MATDILTDEQVDLLNQARTLLKEYAARCGNQSYSVPSGYNGGDANVSDYARVEVLAIVAEDAIFTLLNWTNSHRVRPLTNEQLHNEQPEEAAV